MRYRQREGEVEVWVYGDDDGVAATTDLLEDATDREVEAAEAGGSAGGVEETGAGVAAGAAAVAGAAGVSARSAVGAAAGGAAAAGVAEAAGVAVGAGLVLVSA